MNTQTHFEFFTPKENRLAALRKGHVPDEYKGEYMLYLLHFMESIGNPDTPHGTACHYAGIVRSRDKAELARRLNQHRKGYANGSKITRAFFEQGIPFEVAGVWVGVNADFERYFKAWKNHKLFCATCRDLPF